MIAHWHFISCNRHCSAVAQHCTWYVCILPSEKCGRLPQQNKSMPEQRMQPSKCKLVSNPFCLLYSFLSFSCADHRTERAADEKKNRTCVYLSGSHCCQLSRLNGQQMADCAVCSTQCLCDGQHNEKKKKNKNKTIAADRRTRLPTHHMKKIMSGYRTDTRSCHALNRRCHHHRDTYTTHRTSTGLLKAYINCAYFRLFTTPDIRLCLSSAFVHFIRAVFAHRSRTCTRSHTHSHSLCSSLCSLCFSLSLSSPAQQNAYAHNFVQLYFSRYIYASYSHHFSGPPDNLAASLSDDYSR